VEERVEALPSERSTEAAGVFSERAEHYTSDFFQNGGGGDQLDSSFEEGEWGFEDHGGELGED
jgi:hypothetical protein